MACMILHDVFHFIQFICSMLRLKGEHIGLQACFHRTNTLALSLARTLATRLQSTLLNQFSIHEINSYLAQEQSYHITTLLCKSFGTLCFFIYCFVFSCRVTQVINDLMRNKRYSVLFHQRKQSIKSLTLCFSKPILTAFLFTMMLPALPKEKM